MKEKKVDFLIRYEHKVRELESIMLLKIELERRGYTVDFVGNYDYKCNTIYKPKVMVAPSLYATEQIARDLVEYGILKKVANLLWEQLTGTEEENDPNGSHNVTGISARTVSFCWGEKSRERIIKAGVPSERAILAGHINTDLLRGKFRHGLVSKKELGKKYDLDPNKRWNLFISSFLCCEMDEFQHSNLNNCWGIDGTAYFTELCNKSRKEIFAWFRTALTNYPDDIIIYRPHPDEIGKSQELWDMAKEYSNFRIISEDAIKHWIYASDKVYNWYSTSQLDAYVLEKPIRLIRPYKIHEDLDYYIFINSQQLTTEADFLADYENLEVIDIVDQSLLSSYYYLPENYVYQRICDVLEEMYHSNKYDMHYTFAERVKYTYKHWRMRILYPLRGLKTYLVHIPGFKGKIQSQREFLDILKAGYEKNVATIQDIEDIYNRVKPIVYGE